MSRLTRLCPALVLLMAVAACSEDDPAPAAQANTGTPTPSASVEPRTTAPDDPADTEEEQRPTDAATDDTDYTDDAERSAEEDDANDDVGEDTNQDKPADQGNTVKVDGGPFDRLTFAEVDCMGDGKDFYVQTQSSDPLVIVTVLFAEGKAVHTSAQTDPDSGDSTIWSDEDPDTLAASVSREDDAVTFDGTALAAFDDDSTLTLSGTLTCTSTTA